ncbi:MAG: EAL domain-containing protein [Spirulina sp. SIO3F2]|nr:EAL domain-containing protein [Spirulina sp. SIO3F2]
MSDSRRFADPRPNQMMAGYMVLATVGLVLIHQADNSRWLQLGVTLALFLGLVALSIWLMQRYRRRWHQGQATVAQWQAHSEAFFAAHPHPMWIWQPEAGQMLSVNDAALQLYGYSQSEFLSLTLEQLRQAAPPNSERKSEPGVEHHCTVGGACLTVRIQTTPYVYQNQTAQLFWVEDLTQQDETLAQLRTKETQYRMLASNFPHGAVMLYDQNLRYTLAAGKQLRLLQADSQPLEGRTVTEAIKPDTSQRLEPLYRKALSGESNTTELPLGDRTYLAYVLPVYDAEGAIASGMSVTQDITDHKQMEHKLQYYAFYDQSTQLPNKIWFLDYLEDKLQACQSGVAGFFSIFFLELERFDSVKYSLGHQWAEQMMLATADRLTNCLNLSEPVSRIGDHALALILSDLHTSLDANAIAEYIHQQLNQPLEIDDQELFSTVTIGIAILDSPELVEQLPADVIQAADTAMNYARMMYLSHAIFEPSMSEQAVGRFHLETNLRWAIKREEFTVFYQPIISLRTGQLVGFESLIRWQHPEMGWIAPSTFIPVAEETGLIGLIDWWVLGESCRHLGQWQRQYQQPLVISVNASGALLSQFGFQERLRQVTLGNRLRRGSLKLEVTERVMMEQHTAATGLLSQIKNLGVQLSIDDFGTGYSCLERLHQLPIDVLKIDASFIHRMLEDQDSLEIVHTIVALAHSLSMDVLAEGVESQAQLAQLNCLACDYAQGYLFSEPITAAEVEALLAKNWQPPGVILETAE